MSSANPPGPADSLDRPGENIALLSFALKRVREAAFLIDGDSRLRYVNDEACRSLEYTAAELLNLRLADINPDFAPAMMPAGRGDLQTSGSVTVESRFRTKSGRFFPVEISANYFAYDGLGYNLALVRDISERHEAEEAIRVNETRLRATLDNTPNVAVQWYDGEGRVRYWNAASETFYGWTSAEAIGKTLDQLIHTPEEAAGFRRILDGIRDTGKPYGPYESPVHHRDGSAGWVLATTFGIPMGGNQVGFVCMDVDITDLKQAEEALRDSEASLRNLAETAFEGIMIHEQGLILAANPQFARLFGYDSPDDLVGRDGIERLLTPASREVVRARMSAGVNAELFEVTGVRRDGSTFLGETQSCDTTFRGRKARVVAVRDITERRHLEERLRQAEKMEAVGQLAGGVAHDFNNMLNVILGHTELALHRAGPDSPLIKDLTGIEKAARRSADLTGQLLAFARKQTITPRVIDLNHSVTDLMDMLRRMIPAGIDISLAPGDGPHPVLIDPSQLVQILANLMVNARDAIGEVGRVTIGTTIVRLDEAYCALQPESTPGAFVRLDISDDGSGMDDVTRARIFEPFFTTKPAGQGTGLGLATVYGIVKQNGGFITVDSEPGRGTTFQVHLPHHVDGPVEPVAERVARSGRGGTETILLVEDESMVLGITKSVLEDLGYTVLAAASPAEALRLAAESGGRIDLLITDIVMPGMNGLELSKRLASQYVNLRSLYISGYTADVIAPQGVLPEGVHFLQKPFRLHELAAHVRGALGDP